MALCKLLCAVAVTIFLAPNGCLSQEFGAEMENMSQCGLGGPDLQPLNMPWRVIIRGDSLDCRGTLISGTEVLTSCGCNGSLAQVQLSIGPSTITFQAASFEVFGDDEEAGVDVEDIVCFYTLSVPSTETPICTRGDDSGTDIGTAVFVDLCNTTITEPNACSTLSGFEEDQVCAVISENIFCLQNEGEGAMYFDNSWFISGITTTRQDSLGLGDPIAITPVSFPDNDKMTNDFNDLTPTPMLQTSDFPSSTDTPDFTSTPDVTGTPDFNGTPDFTSTTDFTTLPQPPTKCPKPHPPKTTKPPCGCGDDEEDGKDDSVFGSGVMMHSSLFILFCVLVSSLYSTYC